VSNDLFHDAPKCDVKLERMVLRVRGDCHGDPAVSSDVTYDVEVSGESGAERLRELVDPRSMLRRSTPGASARAT
jgi:hypothetical protein